MYVIAAVIIALQALVIVYMAWDSSYGCLTRAAFNLMYPVLRTLGYTFIACDVDKFKQLNTTYGHERVNHLVKGAIRRFSRGGDLVFRVYSGDEFIIATRSHNVHTIMHRLIHTFAWHGMSLTANVVTGTLETTMLKILSDKQSTNNPK